MPYTDYNNKTKNQMNNTITQYKDEEYRHYVKARICDLYSNLIDEADVNNDFDKELLKTLSDYVALINAIAEEE